MQRPVNQIELRHIVQTIRRKFGLDLDVLSQSHLRVVLTGLIMEKGMRYPDILVQRMLDYPYLLQELIYELDQPESEMFRDPEVWVQIRNVVLPSLAAWRDDLTAWIPGCSSGYDLSSLAILLQEEEPGAHKEMKIPPFRRKRLEERMTIRASSFSRERLEEARRGILPVQTLEWNRSNYMLSGGHGDFDHYVEKVDTTWRRKNRLPGLTSFEEQGLLPGRPEWKADLVLFRNRLLQLNREAAGQVLYTICDTLRPGGFLVLGFLDRYPDPDRFPLKPLKNKLGIYERT